MTFSFLIPVNKSESLFSFVLTGFSFLILLTQFEVLWWTNDDSAMSMIAHGYAAFDSPSSNIFFFKYSVGEACF